MALNSLTLEMMTDEIRIKNNAAYQNPLYVQLFNDFAETDSIIKFIEQCSSVETDIDSDSAFEALYPMKNAGFLGVNFDGITGIAYHRQVTDTSSLKVCRYAFLNNHIKYGKDEDLPYLLQIRFPNFFFTKEAQDDILWWKKNENGILDSLIMLLDDISAHPFSGGLGKTEVLSYTKTPVASKRITKKDRLTYTYEQITKVHRCKEHY